MSCLIQTFDKDWVVLSITDVGYDVARAQYEYVKVCLNGLSDDKTQYVQLYVPGHPELTVTSYFGIHNNLAGLNLAEPGYAAVKIPRV